MRKNRPNTNSIINSICQAAKAYQINFVGKTFLYVFDNRCIEVIYRVRDFCHLTGVDTTSGASSFFKDALQGRLRSGQIHFSSRHPYDLCVRKMQHIQNLKEVITSNVLILENVTTNSCTYNFGFTDLNFTLCLVKDCDVNGVPKSKHYIAASLRDENCSARSGKQFVCEAIFSKANNKAKYDTVCFCSNDNVIHSLSDEVKFNLCPSIIETLESHQL